MDFQKYRKYKCKYLVATGRENLCNSIEKFPRPGVNYRHKYLKYKLKYGQVGGATEIDLDMTQFTEQAGSMA